MPAPTIPERDEEITAQHIWDAFFWKEGDELFKEFQKLLAKAKEQSRDKAIEECIGALPKYISMLPNCESIAQIEVSAGNTGWNWCQASAIENLRNLKSQPQ